MRIIAPSLVVDFLFLREKKGEGGVGGEVLSTTLPWFPPICQRRPVENKLTIQITHGVTEEQAKSIWNDANEGMLSIVWEYFVQEGKMPTSTAKYKWDMYIGPMLPLLHSPKVQRACRSESFLRVMNTWGCSG